MESTQGVWRMDLDDLASFVQSNGSTLRQCFNFSLSFQMLLTCPCHWRSQETSPLSCFACPGAVQCLHVRVVVTFCFMSDGTCKHPVASVERLAVCIFAFLSVEGDSGPFVRSFKTGYSRLKTTVRRHIDQRMRTRNFRARSEIVERGAVTKSQKGRKASAERKMRECYQWKANGQCSKGDSCSFSHDPASGNRSDQRQEGQSSSLHQKRRHRLTERYPQKVQTAQEKVLLEKVAELRAEIY